MRLNTTSFGGNGASRVTCSAETSYGKSLIDEEVRRLQESDQELKRQIEPNDRIELYGRPTAWPDYGVGPRQLKRELLDRLKREGYIKSERVEKAMHEIDRGMFMPETAIEGRYSNIEVQLGYNTFMHVRNQHHVVC